ncbi:MAG: sigma-70 family RNA polymerase sigma factor [Bacteroidetes bacterium]|nr:sigma-70 family RNA polymerase sigma factor [Bacteroidota bacterium]
MSSPALNSEPELIHHLKQRSQAAFSYLYDHYSGALYNVIISIVHEKETANDVLQEVFIKIFRQIDQYDASKGRLFTWMLNISRNAGIDMLRSKQYHSQKQNRELTESVYSSAGTTNLNTDKIGLGNLIKELKDEYMILIKLAYFEGFTQDEISKKLNIPLGTVKTRLRSALIELRSLLKE